MKLRFWSVVGAGVLVLWGCGEGGGGGPGGGGAGGGAGGGTGGGTGGTNGDPVPCEEADEGDVCAMIGDSCDISCTNCQLQCGGDLRWKKECFGCPDMAPAPGEACDPCVNVGACNYAVESTCGSLAVTATCDDVSQTWTFEGETCPSDCYAIAEENACDGTAGCRWLTPGCGGSPLPAAGCFPAGDCATNADCPADRACETASFNPCYMKPCDACGADAKVCLP